MKKKKKPEKAKISSAGTKQNKKAHLSLDIFGDISFCHSFLGPKSQNSEYLKGT
jgi:hypothetical protein